MGWDFCSTMEGRNKEWAESRVRKRLWENKYKWMQAESDKARQQECKYGGI